METGNTEHYLEQLNLTELMEQLNRCFSSAFSADFSLEQLFWEILSGNGKDQGWFFLLARITHMLIQETIIISLLVHLRLVSHLQRYLKCWNFQDLLERVLS